MPIWHGPKLPPYVWVKFQNKRWHVYYRRAGLYVRIDEEPGTAAWYEIYTKIHASFERKPKPLAPAHDTLAAVALEYQQSPKWSKLKPKTRATYKAELDALVQLWGDAKVERITRGLIIALRDKLAKSRSPRVAIERIKVLRLLLGHAYDLDLIDRNHATNVGPPIGYEAEPWRHWEPEEIKLFLSAAAPRWRRAAMVLLYTGLRLGDAVNVERKHVRDGVLRWKTSKKGKPVVIHLHRELVAELRMPMEIESIYLIAGLKGGQMLPTSVNHGINKEFKRLGIDQPPPIHGLRKNAVMRLFEADCSIEEIHAVTGQSRAMIEHYGKQYERERAAKAAILKLERLD